MHINRILDKHFDGRTFEVYARATGESLSTAATFNATYDEMERMGESNGASNGLDIREVK